jgi:hypothetical protein
LVKLAALLGVKRDADQGGTHGGAAHAAGGAVSS